MKTWTCTCNNTLFFDSTRCINCNRDTGICPACRRVVAFGVGPTGEYWCRGKSCLKKVRKCRNNETYHVCNGYVFAENPGSDLCDSCALTTDIPDLTEPENLSRWSQLESAKRRVVRQLRELHILPQPNDTQDSSLAFRFLADGPEPVFTGHADGVVTVNIKEADDVERERARVTFGERHRTLIGHFRHELGHYFWHVAWGDNPPPFVVKSFGDPTELEYEAAKSAYYENGAALDWQRGYISQYATMHPWEDFAESFATYLDILDTVETADHFGFTPQLNGAFTDKLHAYERLGIAINELNRGVGLKDLVPEVFTPVVIDKLKIIDRAVNHVKTRGHWEVSDR